MPEEWGGMGLGHVELAMVQAEAAKAYYGPVRVQLHGARRGQHAHPAALGTDEQKEKYLKPLCEGIRR
jgi:acyl-CoA dehydrogenase